MQYLKVNYLKKLSLEDNMKAIRTVSFLGSGNVATNLATSFFNEGIEINFVFSYHMDNAMCLANKVGATPLDSLVNVNINTDLIIVALKDDTIEEVLKTANFNNCFIVHTSGSFNTEKLASFSNHYGCFYPFQTFRKEVKANLSQVHLFIESKTKEDESLLLNLAQQFSSHVVLMNSKERKALHIAGVGINNFTHYLLSITKQYCEENNLKTDYLTALLSQTIQNSFYSNNGLQLQTGPARRGDVSIINEHLAELKNTPKFKKIYKTISQLILDEFYENQFKL